MPTNTLVTNGGRVIMFRLGGGRRTSVALASGPVFGWTLTYAYLCSLGGQPLYEDEFQGAYLVW